jgi:hypothetical protein
MQMTSGSSRSADLSAAANECVCRETWRWFTTQRLDTCTYSIGSSIDKMWSSRSSFMRFTSAAIVDVLPHPEGPVMSTMPLW